MPNNNIIFVISAAIVFFSLSTFIAFIVILHQRRQLKFKKTTEQLRSDFNHQLLQAQLEIQEDSFNMIGQELHDNVGQLLTTTKLLLGVMEVDIEQNNTRYLANTLQTASQTLSKAIHELRSLSKTLNHDWLYQFDLLENLRLEVDRINTSRDIHVMLVSDYEKLPINSEAQLVLFRVAQEALQNAIRHAHAKQIALYVQENAGFLQLTVKDNGVGFDVVSSKNESLGLRNMEYRIQLLGGIIDWKSNGEEGTAVTIQIPQESLKHHM